jgi:hypothetical protein
MTYHAGLECNVVFVFTLTYKHHLLLDCISSNSLVQCLSPWEGHSVCYALPQYGYMKYDHIGGLATCFHHSINMGEAAASFIFMCSLWCVTWSAAGFPRSKPTHSSFGSQDNGVYPSG